ncbi:YopX family protein [Leadbetterella byssophila]|uniref:YopX family protein n=1 Tax=Leadbetterella byssophila TaxID=316068 RepID=UPI0039A226C1
MKILFRGLRTDGKGWVEGSPFFVEEENVAFIINNCQSLNLTSEDSTFKGLKVIPETLGQYTGLDDKNGNEIFVGDKLSPFSSNYQYEVVFQNGEFGVSNNIGYWGSLSKYRETCEKFNYHFEIIGNVHEQ